MLNAPATVLIDGSSIGFTAGEAKWTHHIESVDHGANQSLGTIKSTKSKEGATLAFGMAELNRERLKIAYEAQQAIETDGDYRVLHVGDDQDMSEHAIIFYTRGEDDKLRKITFHKCVRDTDVEYNMSLENPTVIAMGYKLHMDLSKAEGKRLWEIRDDTSTNYDRDTGL